MKFFLDTANIDEIREWVPTGLVNGVTTNPTLVSQVLAKNPGKKFLDIIAEICDIVPGPVSAEVAATDYATMIQEGRVLAKISSNIAVKVPLTIDGLKVCKALSDEGTMVNVTLCFSVNQALIAAKAGATFISPFIGRLDDIGHDGLQLIDDVCEVYDNYPDLNTEVLAASIRHPMHVYEASRIGAHVATMPASVMQKLFNHPLTDSGVKTFTADWAKTGQSIL